MTNKRALRPIIVALLVVLVGLGIGYHVTTGPETAPSNPPDRGNTEESLPAAPADPQALPGNR